MTAGATGDWDRFAEAPVGTHPPLDAPAYRSTALRHPTRPLVRLPPGLADPTELTGPVFGSDAATAADADLTVGPGGTAVGQRIIVTGRLLDGDGRPIRRQLVEIWQANASGRYRHQGDQWPGALDPNFTGGGRTLTDDDGTYRFTTIRPGAYPWGNHTNAWRPAHIHVSVFGWAFTQRLVARYDHDVTRPEWALGFRFDIVVRGRRATPFEEPDGG